MTISLTQTRKVKTSIMWRLADPRVEVWKLDRIAFSLTSKEHTCKLLIYVSSWLHPLETEDQRDVTRKVVPFVLLAAFKTFLLLFFVLHHIPWATVGIDKDLSDHRPPPVRGLSLYFFFFIVMPFLWCWVREKLLLTATNAYNFASPDWGQYMASILGNLWPLGGNTKVKWSADIGESNPGA